MQLLEISQDNTVVPTDYALMTYPYSDIWSRDSHIKKDLGIAELSYITFMVDPRQKNVFYGYDLLSGERHSKIVDNKFKNYPDWVPDDLVLEGIDQWKEFFYKASPNLKHYDANIIAMNKVTEWYHNLDMTILNPRTLAPIYTPKMVTDGVKNSDEMITKLEALREKIEGELYTSSKTKKDKVINPFER